MFFPLFHRLAALNREVKMKEVQLLDATRRKFMAYQQQQKEAQLARLDDEIRRKAQLRDVETQAAVEDADIRRMELEVQRKLFEQVKGFSWKDNGPCFNINIGQVMKVRLFC